MPRALNFRIYPIVSCPLLVALLPIQRLAGLDARHLYIAYIALALTALIGVTLAWRDLARDPILVLLLSFCALVLAHADSSVDSVRAIAIAALSAACYVVTKDFTMRHGAHWIEGAIVVSLLLAVVLSMLYLYGPLPEIFGGDDPQNMRLTGVVDNPNRLGKMLPAGMLVLLAVQLRPSLRWACIAVLAIGMAATQSKASMLGLAVGVLLIEGAWRARLARLAAIAAVMAAWTLASPSLVEERAANAWLERGVMRSGLAAELERFVAGLNDGSYNPLRVGVTSAMVETPERVIFIEHQSSVLGTGQRGKLWAAGGQVIAGHWAWGVGANGWAPEMKSLVGRSLDSPHNGFLETFGASGALGAALFIALYALLFRRLRGWPLAVAGCAFVIELFDVAILTGHHNATLFLWAAIGAGSAIAGRRAPRPSAPPRFSPRRSTDRPGRPAEPVLG